MSLRLPWWRKVREADICKSSRDIFERFGEGIIADMVSASHAPRAPDLIAMYTDEQKSSPAFPREINPSYSTYPPSIRVSCFIQI
jgi:hypothetical protein